MAYVLAALATNRRAGFSATVLEQACRGAREAGEEAGAEVCTETACLAKFDFKPCLSSFWCARNQGVGCILPEDMGSKGSGTLFDKVSRAHGLLLATPVHTWGPSALAHMFWERLYHFLCSDRLNGLPFGALACATNQGFQRQAIEEMTKWAFCRSTLYQGGVAAHGMDRDRILADAYDLGHRVGAAAILDARDVDSPPPRSSLISRMRPGRFSIPIWTTSPTEPSRSTARSPIGQLPEPSPLPRHWNSCSGCGPNLPAPSNCVTRANLDRRTRP